MIRPALTLAGGKDAAPTDLSEAQAMVADFAAANARDFDNRLSAFERLAETMAGADSCQPVGRREVARRIAMFLKRERLTLEAIEGRAR